MVTWTYDNTYQLTREALSGRRSVVKHAAIVSVVLALCVSPGVAREDPTEPQIAVVRTWRDLVQLEPDTLPNDVRVRIGISRKECPVYGGVVVYCLADGLVATQRRWVEQIGPLPVRVARDTFSERFYQIVDPRVSVAMVGGHKCGKGSALFLFPVVLTNPSDAPLHPHAPLVERLLGPAFDPTRDRRPKRTGGGGKSALKMVLP